MHTLLSKEDIAFKAHCDAFATEKLAPLAKKLGEINDVPQELRTCLAESGLYGPLFPESYGGTGLSAVRICLAREAIAGIYAPADTTLAMQDWAATRSCWPVMTRRSRNICPNWQPANGSPPSA